jgi:3'-5' exoribonuclease
MKIKEMEIGKKYIEYFMVYDKKNLKTKSNNDYIVFTLGDSSSKLVCKVWNNIEDYTYSEGNVIKAEVEVITYNDNKELSIKQHRLAKPEELQSLESDKFIAGISKEKRDEYFSYINAVIKNINNSSFKKLIDLFFDDEDIKNQFLNCPAAVFHHENYIGGLLKHTHNVLKNAISISENYKFIDKDLLVTSVILHDIGKIKNYEYSSVIKVSREGGFLEHISIALIMISEKIKQISDFDSLDKEKLLSCILSSHGEYEFGSPIKPKTVEALLLHHCDLLDSKIFHFVNEFKENPDKEFVWSKSLNTFIWTKLNQ